MLNLLFVDDEADIREILKNELKAFGFRVLLSSNGADAIIAISENKIDLVILDMLMPGMDGIQVIRVIKKWNPSLPIIGLTGYIGQGYISEAAELGVNCLSKPVIVSELIEEINTLLNIT